MYGINNIPLLSLGTTGSLFSVYQQCGCSGTGQFSWDEMIRYFNELSAELKSLRGRGAEAGRRGDLNGAAGSVPSLNVGNAVAIMTEAEAPVCMDLGESAASVGDIVKHLLSLEARGRFLMAAHNYQAGKGALNSAAALYSQILNTDQCGLSSANLIAANTGRPFLYLGWAQAVMAGITWMDIISDPEAVLSEAGLESALNSQFDRVDGLMGSASGARGQFTSFVNSIPGISDTAKNYFQDKLNREFAAALAHVEVGKATLLLQSANALRVNNPETAKAAIQLARQHLLKLLNEMEIRNDPPEELTSTLQSLAWAYSSMANLLEDEQRGSGAGCARMASIIYKYMLFGFDTLTDEEKNLMQNGVEGEEAVWGERAGWTRAENYKNYLNYIRVGFEKVLNGTGHSIWSGSTPYLPMNDSISLDLLGLAGTNELELYLNMADALVTMRSYDEALIIYEKVLSLDKKSWMSESIYMRARTGKAQILTKLADDEYGREHEYDFALENTEEAIDLCEETIDKLLIPLGQTGSLWENDNYILFKYRRELLKAATILAWAYSSQSRYLRDLGRVDEAAEYARRAEALYKALQGEVVAGFDEKFQKYLELIDQNYAHVPPWRNGSGANAQTIMSSAKLRAELKAELNINDAMITVGIADALALQRKFTEAVATYQMVVSEFEVHGKGSRYYQKALLGLAEVQIEQAKILFTQSGNIESALSLLSQIQETLNNRTLNYSGEHGKATEDEWLRGKLLLAQVFGTRGYLLIQKLDRSAGNQQLEQAVQIYEQLAQDIEAGAYTEDTLKEAYLTLSQLYISWGSILALQGERDEMRQEDGDWLFAKLEEAKEKFERALELFGSEGSTTRTSLGKLEARAALQELLAMQAKLYIYRGNYQEAQAVINQGVLSQEDILQILQKGAPRLAYRALTLYAWILNLRGNMKERLEGEGLGRDDFISASEIYAALYGEDVASSSTLLDAVKARREIFTNENFLVLLQTTRGQLKLLQAENLKAAAVRDTTYTLQQDADAAYIQARELLEGIGSNHELYYLAHLAIQDTFCGQVENKIALGKLQEEAGEFEPAGDSYKAALTQAASAAQALMSGQQIRYLLEARTGLRIVSALIWCLDSLGEWKENLGYDTEGGTAPLDYRTALLICRALLIGDDPHNLRNDHDHGEEILDPALSEWAGNNYQLGFDLTGFLEFVRAHNGSLFLSDEVLFAAGQNQWSAKYLYLYNLTASKLYRHAVDFYDEFISELEHEDYKGPMELEYLARSHALIGDVYTFRMADYNTAEGIYGKAQSYLTAYRQQYGFYREMEELQQYINGGFAKVYIEQGHYHDAVEKYQAILGCQFFEDLNLELLGQRDLQNIAELRSKITFKQLQILTRAYLGLGDVYTHYLKKSQKAFKYLNAALFLLEQENFALAPIRRFLAQAHLGLGNVYQLRLKDYEKAINCFTAGLQVLAQEEEVNEEALRAIIDVKSRELVVRLLTSLSAVYAEQGEKDESEAMENLAELILEAIPDDPYDPDLIEIRELFGETQVGNEGTLQSQAHLTLEPFFSWISTSRGGAASWSGPSFGLRAGFGLAHDLRLNLDYQATLPTDPMTINFENPNSGEEIERLLFDDSHALTLSLAYEHDWDFLTTRLNAGVTYGLQNYELSQCNWGPAFQHCGDLTTLEQNLSTLRLHLQNEWFWNYSIDPDTTFLAGGSFGASFLYRFGLPPIYQSQLISYQEQSNSLGQAIISDPAHAAQYRLQQNLIEGHMGEVENQEDPYYFSFFVNPQLGFSFAPLHLSDSFMLYYPNLFLGAHLGYEPEALTDMGRWPLYTLNIGDNGEPGFSKIDPFRWALTASFSTTFAFGEDFRFKIPLYLGAQYGWGDNGYFNLNVNTGFNFGLDWLQFLFGYSHYQDPRQNQSDSFNFFLRFIPWF